MISLHLQVGKSNIIRIHLIAFYANMGYNKKR